MSIVPKKKTLTGAGILAISSERTVEYTLSPYTLYQDAAEVIPPYCNYVSVRKNILTKDDNSRTYLPYNGDTFTFNPEEDYAWLEETLEGNKRKHRRRCDLLEKAKIWAPYALRFLSFVGCDPDILLSFLSDSRVPAMPPRELPPLMASSWRDYRCANFADREKMDKIETIRKGGRRSMPQELPRNRLMAAACVANKAFLNVAGFSLWHVFKHRLEVSKQPRKAANARDVQSRLFETYTKFECLVCNLSVFRTPPSESTANTCIGMSVLAMASTTKRARRPTGSESAMSRICQWKAKVARKHIRTSMILMSSWALMRTARYLDESGRNCGRPTKDWTIKPSALRIASG